MESTTFWIFAIGFLCGAVSAGVTFIVVDRWLDSTFDDYEDWD